MMFGADLLELVLAGKKTQTRRPFNGKGFYQAGRAYPVTAGRGKPALARIRVIEAVKVPVQPISRADAAAEGFRSASEFYDRWFSMYGTLDGNCTKITFRLDEKVEE